MKMIHPTLVKPLSRLAVLLCFSLLFTSPLSAYDSGDFLLRVGVITVAPDDESSAINLNGANLAGTSAGVDDNTQLGITGTYMFSSHIGLELLAATPFDHDITSVGLGVPVVGSTKHLPPTLCLQYYPMKKDSRFQPYVGVGLNYTMFFDEEPTSAMTTATGLTDLELDDSFGLAFQVGMDYLVTDHWLLNIGVWQADIDTTATFTGGGSTATVDVDIDPIVFNIGLGYAF